ncbi:MAG: alpha/beta hydrolase, partial [Pseudomonadota bacterium]
PLAATRARAEFIGIGYGLVVDILEEDAAQVALELREAGFGDDVVEKAREITDITARLAVSGYTDGLDDLDAVRQRYGDEPWYPFVRGGFTGVILGLPTARLRNEGIPMFDRLRIDWSIKPMDVLRTVEVPQLWVLAADDREAPVATTLERLKVLRGEGKDIQIVVYPNTDHGMREYVQAADGSRAYTRVTDTFYDVIADWAKGELASGYAESVRQ